MTAELEAALKAIEELEARTEARLARQAPAVEEARIRRARLRKLLQELRST
ncbi:MAG: hypothetical protein WB801_00590 [Candidatus Dormiibacterota bacterium]